MRHLGSLLTKFAHLTPPEGIVRDTMIMLTKELCGITLKEYEVQFKNGIVQIMTHPARKSEILLHKTAILSALQQKSLLTAVRDIR